MNTVCMICRNRNGNTGQDMVISNLERTLGTKSSDVSLPWRMDIHTRCRYGISCSDLTRADNALILRAENLNIGKIFDNERLYRETLYSLQGHFPCVYRALEELYRKKIK